MAKCILDGTVRYGRKAKTLITVVCSFSIPFSTVHNAWDHDERECLPKMQRRRMRRGLDHHTFALLCKDGKARRAIIGGQNFTKQKERNVAAFLTDERTESSIRSIRTVSPTVRRSMWKYENTSETTYTCTIQNLRVANIWVRRACVCFPSVNALKSFAWREGKEIGVGKCERWTLRGRGICANTRANVIMMFKEKFRDV